MTGQIGDLIFQLMGKQDPRDAIVAAMAGGGTQGAPAGVGDTPAAGGTGGPGGAPVPDQTPEVYKSPPDLVSLYSDLLKRQDIDAGINRGVGLIGASLAQEQNRSGILDAFGVGSGGNMGGTQDAGGLVNNLLSLRAGQTAAATKAAMRASVPAIAKQLGIDDETAMFLFDSGKLDSVVQEAQKPDNQIITDAATGQSHIVNKKTGEIGPALGGEKPHELAIETDQNTGEKFTVDKVTGERVGKSLTPGVRKTEYVENPASGTKTLVYSDTKEPVPDAPAMQGGGNTELQKNWNAAMRGKAPGDEGYMTLQEYEAAEKAGKGTRFIPVGNGRIFDTQDQKFVVDPNDPVNAVDTDPNNAPVLAPGQVDTDFLSKLPTDTQGIVKGLTDYTLDLSKVSSIRGNERQKLAAAAKRYDPSFDMSQYAARAAMRKSVTSGNYSQAINSSNLVIQHLSQLAKIGDELHNTSYPLANMGKNLWSQQTGDADITNFKTTRAAAAAELAKVFKGTGSSSLTEIKDWEDNLDPNASPEQIKGSITTLVKDLLASRLDTIRSQYTSAMGKPADFSILTDKSRKILKDLGIDPNDVDTADKPDPEAATDEGPSLEDLAKKYKK